MHLLIVTMLSAALGSSPVLRADKLYYGSGRPVTVLVDVPRDADVELALMDAAGRLLAPVQPAARGRVNLARLLPVVAELDETAYLQCMVSGDPFDSSLVLQPMLSRAPPRTEIELHDDGTHRTRIVGWGPAPPAEERPAGTDADAAEGPRGDAGDAAPGAAGPARTIRCGLRVYPERDVLLRTSLGDVRIALRPDEAPNTAWSFLHLVEGGFYDGLIFHRVIPLTRDGDPFVIQGGDPTGTGVGGPGFRLALEPSGLPHDYGVVSMARADHPDTGGSQFFICLSRAGTARLDGQYCAFGEAVSGRDAIDAIAAVRLADVASGRPAEPPVIERAMLLPAAPRLPGMGRTDEPLSRRRRVEPAGSGDRMPR